MARKREKVDTTKLPPLLYTVASAKALKRAVERGYLGGTDGEPVRLHEDPRGEKGGTSVILRVASRLASEDGRRFYRVARGRYETARVPLKYVSCPHLPGSVKGVKRVDAAGGVVVDASGKRVLLLLKSEGKRERWVLPKGKRRFLERRRRAARREVLEETGVEQVEVGAYLTRECYFDKMGKDLVFKEVSYYLMRCPKGRTRLDVRKEESFVRGQWMSFGAALKSTSPVRAHRTLRKARAAIKNGGG
jgi:ADP-ribose pyrophosphatase YjhB (NUDIX family)